MYQIDEVISRSKDRIRDNGEVFTPAVIVEQMLALVPDSSWEDEEYCYLDPACGNGNILLGFLVKRIESGISLETAINTIVGIDICETNVRESRARLYEFACERLEDTGVRPKSKKWLRTTGRIAAILNNNIFQADALEYMNSEEFEDFRFFFSDPTGKNKVFSQIEQKKKLLELKEGICKGKPFAEAA